MRVPRTIHLLGHDWRVEFVPPEKLAAIIRFERVSPADDAGHLEIDNLVLILEGQHGYDVSTKKF